MKFNACTRLGIESALSTYTSETSCRKDIFPSTTIIDLPGNGGKRAMPLRLLSSGIPSLLHCLMAVAWLCGVTSHAGLSIVTTGNVLSYDLAVHGGTSHAVYESGGNVYHSQSVLGSDTWSPATLLGAGSNPSVTFGAGGVPIVSLVSGGNVVIASRNAGTWSTASLGNPNGTTRAMIRTDGSNTIHLLVEGSGTGGRGSIDYASFNGSSWSSFANLAYGWYDSGSRSGNYYHQPVLGALADGAGYHFVFQFDNWGGQAGWSSKALATSGVTPGTSHGYGWNSALKIADGGILSSSTSLDRIGYSIDGNAYVQTLSGGVWSTASLGGGTNVAVSTARVLFESGTSIKAWDGSTVSNLVLEGSPVLGHLARISGDGTSFVSYLTNGTNNLMFYTVPEPSVVPLLGLSALAGCVIRRRRSNQ